MNLHLVQVFMSPCLKFTINEVKLEAAVEAGQIKYQLSVEAWICG